MTAYLLAAALSALPTFGSSDAYSVEEIIVDDVVGFRMSWTGGGNSFQIRVLDVGFGGSETISVLTYEDYETAWSSDPYTDASALKGAILAYAAGAQSSLSPDALSVWNLLASTTPPGFGEETSSEGIQALDTTVKTASLVFVVLLGVLIALQSLSIVLQGKDYV